MHVIKLLHKFLGKSCKNIDKRLIKILFESVETLTRSKRLSISGLGRYLHRPIKVKHAIKCMDRLFGNKRMYEVIPTFYQAMNKILLNGNKRPIIAIDWSGLTVCGKYHLLRAGVTVGGRTLTLYEEAFHISEYANHKTHRQFLFTLKEILPDCCCPIIVTDAGFRNNWFRIVRLYGWDFVGRVRHNTKYKDIKNNYWEPVKDLYNQAKNQAFFVGQFMLSKTTSLTCYFHLMKQKKKYRKRVNLIGKKIQSSVSLKHAKRGNEPWLIVTSLNPNLFSANKIMMIYKKRMQIEEAFRDLKNSRNGFSLRHCRSIGKGRLSIALLIGALGMFILWLLGMTAKLKKIHYSFQANTERKRNVLSNFIIGWQVLEKRIRFSSRDILDALQEIVLCANQ
jgi:hypothetical protein